MADIGNSNAHKPPCNQYGFSGFPLTSICLLLHLVERMGVDVHVILIIKFVSEAFSHILPANITIVIHNSLFYFFYTITDR